MKPAQARVGYRHALTMLLCVLLLLSQAMTTWVAQQAVTRLTSGLPDNIELLCTGSSMKFVSISESLALGQFVYVDLPEHTQQSADFWCDTVNAIFDHEKYEPLTLPYLSASQRYAALLQRRLQQPYTAFAYTTAQPRSPPFSLV